MYVFAKRRSGSDPGNPTIASITMTRLNLLCFWIKHQVQTSPKIDQLVKVNLLMINFLKEQKRTEEKQKSEKKEPEYTSLALDLPAMPKAFEKVKAVLTRDRGMMEVTIAYVIRHALYPEEADKDNPPFGGEDTKYTTIDQEMIACPPIVTNETQYDKTDEELETISPFEPTFITDSKKVWEILHEMFALAGVWQHVKKFTAAQKSCQVWLTLHNHFFGGDKINTMYSCTLTSF